jgi:hypothetical protein
MQGTSEFLEKVLVNNRTVDEKLPYAMAAFLSAVIIPGLLFLVAAPRLRLEGGAPRLNLPRVKMPSRGLAGLSIIACLVVSLATTVASHAAGPAVPQEPLQMTIDLDHKTTNTGDKIDFHTVVTNTGTEKSSPFHVSMNIIKIGSGDPVDPEDWSPERSQEITPLAPGQSATQAWIIHTILEGNYMVYMTIIPTPKGPDTTTQTISSTGLHLVVKPSIDTNPGGVLPVAIMVPAALTLGTAALRWRQRGERK